MFSFALPCLGLSSLVLSLSSLAFFLSSLVVSCPAYLILSCDRPCHYVGSFFFVRCLVLFCLVFTCSSDLILSRPLVYLVLSSCFSYLKVLPTYLTAIPCRSAVGIDISSRSSTMLFPSPFFVSVFVCVSVLLCICPVLCLAFSLFSLRLKLYNDITSYICLYLCLCLCLKVAVNRWAQISARIDRKDLQVLSCDYRVLP